ncbi:MAG: hypothetical protein M0Z77_03775 [Thermoplasmatales archaeon]|jgi:hypothetical protein|nr:hypothetical protein [Candidatus Thermoplasmatota archaeon]MCL6003598.1 hypothetical protein [Candidatus Thermoplasmatota archaeon]MDA8054757.1 hypothetical protein [Thermoplasmatales archaeon]
MTDLRDQVVEDRGVIKKIQLLFPGYHGYRINEDLRDADVILKDELYKKMLDVITNLKTGESSLVSAGQFKGLESIGALRSRIQSAAEIVKHHGAGYSGISAPIRVDAKKISALYDLDMKIFDQIQNLQKSMNLFVQECMSGGIDQSKMQDIISTLSAITDLNNSRETLLYGGV